MNEPNPIEQWRLFAAAILSLVVIVVWQAYFVEPPAEPPVPVVEEVLATGEDLAEAPGEVASPAPEGSLATEATDLAGEAERVAAMPSEVVEAASEERIFVEREAFRAELSNRGGQLVSFRLPDHLSAAGEPLDLVRQRAGGSWDFGLGGSEEIQALNGALFVVDREVREGVDRVSFHYRDGVSDVAKSFGFRPDGLVEVAISVAGRKDWKVLLGPGIRNPSPEELENRFARRSAVYRSDGKVETVASQKADEGTPLPVAGLTWAGLEDNYFLSTLIFEVPPAAVSVEPMLVRREEGGLFSFGPVRDALSDEEEELTRDFALVVTPGQEEWHSLAFFGAKQYDRLAALPYGLQETVDFGMFGFLSRPLLWGLKWIHSNVVPNYGWSIILMTFLIKIVLFPLTHKGYVSMQKMQQLNPKVQAIRQKYRPKLKDKQGRPNTEMQRKMNEEVMALYKAEGVNPAGGCLPLLLQMPVLLAFYRLLSASVEVRGAAWIGWITDLAAPDPYRVLPIVMGVSQFVQQKLTPASGDPMQRRIFAMMPIFFTVLFMGFPSGLVLYWLTNNLLQIVQQAGYNAWKKRRGES